MLAKRPFTRFMTNCHVLGVPGGPLRATQVGRCSWPRRRMLPCALPSQAGIAATHSSAAARRCQNRVELPLFMAWILKSVILRYGGRRGYTKALPFFLGLLAGQSLFVTALRVILNHWQISIQ